MFARPRRVSRERTPDTACPCSPGHRAALRRLGVEGHLDRRWGWVGGENLVTLFIFIAGTNHGDHRSLLYRKRVVTCTVDGVSHGGCHDAGQPRACPKLQHSASLEEVPSEQDIVCQEEGTPPHLQEGTKKHR